MFDAEYWNNRMLKNGHTGHAEPFYYCFDQEARIFAISQIINQYSINKDSALDFGCGSGDFIELLNSHFKNVFAYDISDIIVKKAQLKFKDSASNITSTLDKIKEEQKFDLILTVTVLQSLAYSDLENTLNLFKDKISENGIAILMEFFVADNLKFDGDKVNTKDFLALLSKNNFEVIDKKYFYNPILIPSKSWLKYNSNFILKTFKPIKRFDFVQKLFKRKARKIIQSYADVLLKQPNQFKIYILKKA